MEIKTSLSNNVASERSRNSVIQGNPIFVWNRESNTRNKPYHDKNYHIPYNPPPNEVNFIGGLGKNRGNLRSKVHPNRATIVQKIYNMRNQNRIDVCFTKPLSEVNNCVHPKSHALEEFNSKTLKNIVQKISFADIIETKSTSSIESDSSQNALLDRKGRKKYAQATESEQAQHEQHESSRSIDGKLFYMRKSEMQQKANEIVEKSLDKNLTIEHVCPTADTSFRRWAIEHEQRKNAIVKKTIFSLYKKFNIIDDDADHSDNSSRRSINLNRNNLATKRRKRKHCKNTLNHLFGYMYGKFTKPKLKRTNDADRFGIPFTMIDRALAKHKMQKIQENVLRTVRLSHMGYYQPPSKDDDSSDNESTQNVKRLALLRTPYFLIPTIKISRVRKKERFRNKYLQKDRLNRINLLLYDHDKKHSYNESDVNKINRCINDVKSDKYKTKKLNGREKMMRLIDTDYTDLTDNPIKTKYLAIVREQYEKQQRICEPSMDKIPTFDEFKAECLKNGFESELHALDSKLNGKDAYFKSQDEEEPIESISVARELFQSKKHFRFRKADSIDGPLYINPHLIDQLQKPKKFVQRCKYYTNLFKSKFGIRNRLQVNDDPFEFSKIGIEPNAQYPTFPTEWDEYFVHEMRYRRTTKKFCVKTDILKLREIVRKKFLMYYAQENLFDLKARQMAENRIMDDVEQFNENCYKLFDGWAGDAYNKITEKNKQLHELQCENVKLNKRRDLLTETYDKLTKDILLSEHKWDFLLRIQNYYYLLMDVEWREENDWIHRNFDNKLLEPLQAIVLCSQRNIREKIVSSAEAVQMHYDEYITEKLEKMKAIQPKVDLLQKNMESLLKKSFIALKQNNKLTWVYKELKRQTDKLQNDMQEFLKQQKLKIAELFKRQQLAQDRQQWLQRNSEQLLNKRLAIIYRNPLDQRILAITDVLYEHFMPSAKLKQQLLHDTNQSIKFAYIHQYAMNLLQTLDKIPIDILTVCEKRIRKQHAINELHAKQAIITQKRFEMLSKQIKHQFTAPATYRRIKMPLRRRCIVTIPKIISRNLMQ